MSPEWNAVDIGHPVERLSPKGLIAWTALIGSRRWRHPAAVLAIHPRDDRVIAFDASARLRVWDRDDGRELASSGPWAADPRDFALSPDSRVAAIVARDDLLLVEVESGRLLRSWKAEPCSGPYSEHEEFTSASFDGATLVVAGGVWTYNESESEFMSPVYDTNRYLQALDVSTGAQLWRKPAGELLYHRIAPLPGRRLLAIGGRQIDLWDLGRSERIGRWDEATSREVTAIAASADGRLALIGYRDEALRLWDLERGGVRWELRLRGGPVTAVAWISEEEILAGNRDGCISRRRGRDGRLLKAWSGHMASVRGLAVAAGTVYSGGSEGVIRRWRLDDSSEVLFPEGHVCYVHSLAFSPCGSRLFSIGYDGSLRAWEVANGACLFVARGHDGPIRALSVSPDGKLVFTGGKDGTVRGWYAKDGSPRSRWQIAPSRTDSRTPEGGYSMSGEPVGAIAVSPDGRFVAVGGDRAKVAVLRLSTGKEVASADCTMDAREMAFVREGKGLLVGASYAIECTWSGRALRRRRNFGAMFDNVFSIDVDAKGTRALVTGFFRRARLLDLEKGDQQEVGRKFEFLSAAAFVRDGRCGVVAGILPEGGAVLSLVDLASGETLDEAPLDVPATCLAARGDLVAIGRRDGTISLHSIRPAR